MRLKLEEGKVYSSKKSGRSRTTWNPTAVLAMDSAATFKKSHAVPKMLISGKTGLKALAHKVQGALKPYACNGFNMSVCIVIAKDSSWHAGTLPRRRIF